MGDKQVESAIAIEIHEAGTRTPAALAGQAGLASDVAESTVAVVAKQLIGAAKVADEEVDTAVVVDVSHGDTHAIAAAAKARVRGDIGKVQAWVGRRRRIVVVQPGGAGIASRAGRGPEPDALQHQQVESSIIVVIKQRHAGANDFGIEKFTRPAIRMLEVNAAGLCHFGEQCDLRFSRG